MSIEQNIEHAGEKRKRWNELFYLGIIRKEPFVTERHERRGLSYPPDCLMHWCHQTYHSLVPCYRKEAMLKWFSEMPKVETEPGVVSVCPSALLKKGHDPIDLEYSVGNVDKY